MFIRRKVVPALCLAVSMSGLAVYAASTTTPPGEGPSGHHWRGHHHHGLFGVLHKLKLTDAQKAQVKSILAGQKSQFAALRTSSQDESRSAGEHGADRHGGLWRCHRDGPEECRDAHPAHGRDLDQHLRERAHADAARCDPGHRRRGEGAREQRMQQWKAAHPSAGSTGE